MGNEKKRNSFTGSLGFVMAAAGSAVGLGNIWRFPYLAAKDGGGLFLVIYIILAVTFGFTLLTTEIAIGRKTKQSPLTAYSKVKKGWGFLGVISCLVPMIIMPYYCVIGGWVVKYFLAFLTGEGTAAAEDGYFTGFITGEVQPIVLTVVFLGVTAFIVFRGVEKGIEKKREPRARSRASDGSAIALRFGTRAGESAVLLDRRFQLDQIFALRAKPGTYFLPNMLVAMDSRVDVKQLRAKGVTILTDRVLTTQSMVEDL